MAGRYLSKNILEDQQQFIRLLDEYEMDIFCIGDIELTLTCPKIII